MGRYAEPLINTPPLPPIENGVEVLIAESRLAHRANDDPDDVEEEQLMTVLVSFDPQPAQRSAAHTLASTFIAARTKFEQLPAGRELADWLNELLYSRVSASLCIVLSLPPVYSEDTAQQIEGVLAGLRNRQHHHLRLAVAVSLKTLDWGDCCGIDGFVSADARGRDRASLQVFSMLAALMAPGLTFCVDWEELRSIFGTLELPSRVASGVWLEELATFVWATAEDRELMKNCKAIASMPARCLQLASQHRLIKEICKSTAKDSAFVMIAPYGMSSEPLLVDQIVPVFLIAAPPAKKMFAS